MKEDALVFEYLSDYRIGLPNESTFERKKLVGAIEETLDKLHNLGLVHMDFYLSNIMWNRDTNGSYHVKIIDFDGIHRIGERFSEYMDHRLEGLGFSEEMRKGGADVEFDNAYLRLVKKYIDQKELFYQLDQRSTKASLDSFIQKRTGEAFAASTE